MKTKLLFTLTALVLSTLNSQLSTCFAQTTTFTYQGSLKENGVPVTGLQDFEFRLFDAATVGVQAGPTLLVDDVGVTNGLFTVNLDFGGNFPGADRWLAIAVRPGASAGVYTPLTPRQGITPTPYAIRALTAGSAGSATTATSVAAGAVNNLALAGDAVDGAKILNGSITSVDLTASLLNNTFWNLGGNAGTTPVTQFLGTTDNQPLEFHVNGQRALRLEPTGSNYTVNVIGGSVANSVGAGVVGATIGGGSGRNAFAVLFHRVEGDFGTVSGGADNKIQTDADSATIGGGFQNTIQPYAEGAAIGGGVGNTIQTNTPYATIGGGVGNTIQANANGSTIGGGQYNTIQPNTGRSTIGGGNGNTIQIDAGYSTIGGGLGNTIQTNADGATIGGGQNNTIQDNSQYATIGGGFQNRIQPNASYATIPGGFLNRATNYAFAAGSLARADHTGAFVWADSTPIGFFSTADNQFLIRASGNVGINKNNPVTALDVSGTVTATSFSGSGAGLTGLNAAGLSGSVPSASLTSVPAASLTGTVADALLSANVSLLGQTIESLEITDGTVVNADLSAAAGIVDTKLGTISTAGKVANSATTATSANTANAIVARDASGNFSAGNISATSFSGSGAGLTSLNAANLTGTVADARLSANVALRGGGNVFTGTQTISSGSLGIGITPQSTLDVNGTARIEGANNWGVSGGEGDFRVGNDSYRFKIGVANAGGGAGDVWMRAHGGIERINIKAPGGTRILSNEAESSGVSLAANGTSWGVISDRNVKKDFAAVDSVAILEKLAAMPITQWHYKWEESSVTPHIGPMAQDFKAAFYPGTDDKSITTQEADGVALAAIQGLNQKLEAEGKSKDVRIAELEKRLSAIETLLQK